MYEKQEACSPKWLFLDRSRERRYSCQYNPTESQESKPHDKGGVMPTHKRKRRERTHDWQDIEQAMHWPEQEVYERLRPILLFGETAGQRAKEINAAQRTLSRKADDFERDGMRNLFSSEEPREQGETLKTLPSEMHQLIVDVHAELPDMS